MGAPDILGLLTARGLTLRPLPGGNLEVSPRSALTDELRSLIREHKAELLDALEGGAGLIAFARQRKALAFLEAHPNVKRTCFADVESDPANIILTVALREPWGVVEVLVRRERFDALALMDLSLRYPDTAVNVPEH
jgi:hypothetical protein